MVLSSIGKLAVTEVAFYVLAFALALFVTAKHGYGRQQGWVWIMVLSVVRIAGSACLIAVTTESNPSSTLLTVSGILDSIGLSFLIQVLLGLLIRLNQSTVDGNVAIPPQVLRLIHLPLLVGVVLGIIGGTDKSSSNASRSSTGQNLLKVSTIIFLLIGLVVGGIIGATTLKHRSIIAGERRLLVAAIACFPLVFVRILYSLLCAFLTNSTTFDLFHPDVIVDACMAVLMEFLVVLIVLVAGLVAPKIPRGAVRGEPGAAVDARPERHNSRAGGDTKLMPMAPRSGRGDIV
ncbi:MAG: hypothetical protein M1838_001053 [Thelocarpon superellum]|nr:MAG: hypothetical protein M1838_001053 [Thelocarpon superellum]